MDGFIPIDIVFAQMQVCDAKSILRQSELLQLRKVRPRLCTIERQVGIDMLPIIGGRDNWKSIRPMNLLSRI